MNASAAWVRKLERFGIHQAPRGIRYIRLSDEVPFGDVVEIDYVTVAMGQRIPKHSHAASAALCIVISGSGRLTVGKRVRLVQTGDVVYIPPGTSHGFSAPEEDMVFLSIQRPPIGDDYRFD